MSTIKRETKRQKHDNLMTDAQRKLLSVVNDFSLIPKDRRNLVGLIFETLVDALHDLHFEIPEEPGEVLIMQIMDKNGTLVPNTYRIASSADYKQYLDRQKPNHPTDEHTIIKRYYFPRCRRAADNMRRALRKDFAIIEHTGWFHTGRRGFDPILNVWRLEHERQKLKVLRTTKSKKSA